MRTVTAKQLKNRTGEILRGVGNGERFLVTRRGRPLALVSPVGDTRIDSIGLRPPEEAWADIEQSLRATRPNYKTWRQAIRASRRRA